MVHICDFDDSFTYNIYSEVSQLGFKARVVPRHGVKEFLETNINTNGKLAIVLGPGPFHPNDYPEILNAVKKIMHRRDLMLMGICLGHQLIARALGLEVKRSSNPKHGEVEVLKLSPRAQEIIGTNQNTISVQRYNSLGVECSENKLPEWGGVECFESNKEIFMISSKGLISYQFHPESVGTSFRSLFFRPLKSFLL